MRKLFVAAGFILGLIPTFATAEPLNTGYNHTTGSLYSIGQQDNYWIKIASYEPPPSGNTTIPVAPAWVINPTIVGWAPVAGARWLGPRPSPASSAGTSPSRPAYSIFRKCFCLLQGFANAQLSFQVRGDDNIQIWLNTITTQLLAPVPGNFFPPSLPHSRSTSNQQHFRAGRNCIYVLVEDQIGVQSTFLGNTGFSLAGTVTAAGLMPGMAAGTEGSFGPCGCPGEPQQPGGPATGTSSAAQDREMVPAIIRFAEARRLHAPASFSALPGPGSRNGR